MSIEELKLQLKSAIGSNSYRGDIKRVSLFGSRSRGTSRVDSDVDLLVEFMPDARISFFDVFDIEEELRGKIGYKIDLVTPDSLSPYFRDEIVKNAEVVYEG